jgi:hypothetical protein
MTNARILRLAAAAALIAPGAALADAHSQVVTASMHAGLAAGASDIDTVHTHLHHTLNCLVGPGGAGFDAKQINPCSQAGKGAIPDEANAAKKAALEKAATAAEAGIAEKDLAAAKKDAADVQAMLKKEM